MCHLQEEKEQSLTTFLWQVLVSTLVQNAKSDTVNPSGSVRLSLHESDRRGVVPQLPV